MIVDPTSWVAQDSYKDEVDRSEPEFGFGELVCIYQNNLPCTQPVLGFVTGIIYDPHWNCWEYRVLTISSQEHLTPEIVAERGLTVHDFKHSSYRNMSWHRHDRVWTADNYNGMLAHWRSEFLTSRGELMEADWQLLHTAFMACYCPEGVKLEPDVEKRVERISRYLGNKADEVSRLISRHQDIIRHAEERAE